MAEQVVGKEDVISPGDAEAGDDDDTYISTDEDSEEKIDKPCKDIKAGLTAALSAKTSGEFKGTFAFSHTYNIAPTPGLNIAGFGPLPLPLTERDAKALIDVCELAPFGKAERTIVDKQVRDTWEIDATKVTFQNPHWQPWFKTVVIPQISQSLGVASISNWELYKLLLYEEGSHFLPHQDTEKCEGMFATVVVVLPSTFEGGQLHFSHSGQEKILDVAGDSGFSTSVLGWYTDVRHEVKPIVKGYRLALSFNLMTPAGAPRPSLSRYSKTVAAVRHVLMSWRQNPTAPEKLVYLLDHEYSSFGFGNGILKGADAYKVDILRLLAKPCRFKVYFATAKLYIKGDAIAETPEDYEMGEDPEVSFTVENIVDINGSPAEFSQDVIGLSHPDDFVPCGLDDREHSKEEYQGYMGNSGGELEYWYNKTVVILWPRNQHENILGDVWFQGAAAKLKTSTSAIATRREKKLWEHLVQRLEGGSTNDSACREVCRAAVRWKNRDFFMRAARAGDLPGRSSGFETLSHEELIDATFALGFQALKPLLTEILAKSRSNAYSFTLIASISDSRASHDLHLAEVKNWCDEQHDFAIKNLKVATPPDVEVFLGISRKKGIDFIRSIILPQLLALNCPQNFWVSFLKELHSERTTISPSADAVDDVVKSTVNSVLQTLEPICSKRQKTESTGLKFQRLRHQPLAYDPQPTLELIRLCAIVQCPEAYTIIFDKIRAYHGEDPARRSTLASQVYRPVLATLLSLTAAPYSINLNTPIFLPILGMIGGEVVDAQIDDSKFVNWKLMIEAAKWCGEKGVKSLQSRILTSINAATIPSDTQIALVKLLRQAWPISSESEHLIAVQGLITTVVKSAVAKGVVVIGPSQLVLSKSMPILVENAKKLLLLCLDSANAPVASELLSRLKSPKNIPAQLIHVAVPFITSLRQILDTHNIDIAGEPYGEFCRTTIITFIDKLMGPQPAADYSKVQRRLDILVCQCKPCQEVKKRLGTEDPAVVIVATKKELPHLEKSLKRLSSSLIIREISKDRQFGIEVTKVHSFLSFSAWDGRRQIAVNAVNAIGPPEIQRAIFGDEYLRVVRLLGIPAADSVIEQNFLSSEKIPRPDTDMAISSASTTDYPKSSVTQSPKSTSVPTVDPQVGLKRVLPSDATADLTTPRKRSKAVTEDIIDLCTPSPSPKKSAS